MGSQILSDVAVYASEPARLEDCHGRPIVWLTHPITKDVSGIHLVDLVGWLIAHRPELLTEAARSTVRKAQASIGEKIHNQHVLPAEGARLQAAPAGR